MLFNYACPDWSPRHLTRHAGAVQAASILLLLIFAVLPAPVLAHSPSSMVLEYDADMQTLVVTITHSVPDPASHYVKKVEINKNGELIDSEDYTSQPLPSTFTYTYTVAADDGDVLDVTAYCSLYGSITEQITVALPSPSPATTITPPTPTIIVSTPSASPLSTPTPGPTRTPLPTVPTVPSPTPAPAASPTSETPGFEFFVALMSVGAACSLIKKR